jgi:NAD(P) transhydrogenase subunit alpha
MKVGVPRETFPGERRVAVTPGVVPALVRLGAEVIVESGAGKEAGFTDEEYGAKGARVVTSRADALQADVVLQVRTLGANPREGRSDLEHLREKTILVGFADPLTSKAEIEALAARGVSLLALELLPRTSRAQSMDALTSMATLAGYKAVLIAAEKLPRIFPMMVTAAGTITPAKLLVVGAGVAGLQAIATARRLGAVVSAYDVRAEVKEQIESLGARFVELPLESEASDDKGYARERSEDFYTKQRELLGTAVRESDVVITTAAVPGKKAPRLVDRTMVEAMTQGSVVVDLGAASGGNCELTRPDESVVHAGVVVLGPTNLPSTVAYNASQMYARNAFAFVQNLVHDGEVRLSDEDDIVRETLVIRDGAIVGGGAS